MFIYIKYIFNKISKYLITNKKYLNLNANLCILIYKMNYIMNCIFNKTV